MTTPAFEAFLARLFADLQARNMFLADPPGEARRAGLSPGEVEAAMRIDPAGLGFAARSFDHKRRKTAGPGRKGTFPRWWSRLTSRSQSGPS